MYNWIDPLEGNIINLYKEITTRIYAHAKKEKQYYKNILSPIVTDYKKIFYYALSR